MPKSTAQREDLLEAMRGDAAGPGMVRIASLARPEVSPAEIAEAARRKLAQRAALEMANAARVRGLTAIKRALLPLKRATFERGAQAPSRIWVEGYVRSDGTRVKGHWRENPNGGAQSPKVRLALASEDYKPPYPDLAGRLQADYRFYNEFYRKWITGDPPDRDPLDYSDLPRELQQEIDDAIANLIKEERFDLIDETARLMRERFKRFRPKPPPYELWWINPAR
jgi:hypothetical protein